MESSTYLEVITPGVTQTRYSMIANILKPISKHSVILNSQAFLKASGLEACQPAIHADHHSEILYILLRFTDLQTIPESFQPQLGGNWGSQRSPSILKG